MKNLLKMKQDKQIVIFSGEGEVGTFVRYEGKKSVLAIKSRLTKERCGGDRWAKAFTFSHELQFGEMVFIDLENGDMRTINPSDIKG